jgi:hypothetical protein
MLEILHSFGSGVTFTGGLIVGVFLFRKSISLKEAKEQEAQRERVEDRLASSAASNFRAAQALERIADKMEGGSK